MPLSSGPNVSGRPGRNAGLATPALALIAADPAKNHESDFLDLRTVRTAANTDALYLGVDLMPGSTKWQQVESAFESEGHRFVIG